MTIKAALMAMLNNRITYIRKDLDTLTMLSLSGHRIKKHNKEMEMRSQLSSFIDMRETLIGMTEEDVIKVVNSK